LKCCNGGWVQKTGIMPVPEAQKKFDNIHLYTIPALDRQSEMPYTALHAMHVDT